MKNINCNFRYHMFEYDRSWGETEEEYRNISKSVWQYKYQRLVRCYFIWRLYYLLYILVVTRLYFTRSRRPLFFHLIVIIVIFSPILYVSCKFSPHYKLTKLPLDITCRLYVFSLSRFLLRGQILQYSIITNCFGLNTIV